MSLCSVWQEGVPNAAGLWSSTPIHLGDGQQISNADIHASNSLPAREIEVGLDWDIRISLDSCSPNLSCKQTDEHIFAHQIQITLPLQKRPNVRPDSLPIQGLDPLSHVLPPVGCRQAWSLRSTYTPTRCSGPIPCSLRK